MSESVTNETEMNNSDNCRPVSYEKIVIAIGFVAVSVILTIKIDRAHVYDLLTHAIDAYRDVHIRQTDC